MHAVEHVNGSHNLHFYPEYRGRTYTYKYRAVVPGFESQSKILSITITESNIPEIEFTSTPGRLTLTDMTSNVLQPYNLTDYFITYPFANELLYNVYVTPDLPDDDSRKRYDVHVDNDTNTLQINTNVRDYDYNVHIVAYDPYFINSHTPTL